MQLGGTRAACGGCSSRDFSRPGPGNNIGGAWQLVEAAIPENTRWIAAINLGSNDIGFNEPNPTETWIYKAMIESIIYRLRLEGAERILLMPPAQRDTPLNGKETIWWWQLLGFGLAVYEIAEEDPCVEVPINPFIIPLGYISPWDRVHFTQAGHNWMADGILAYLNENPKPSNECRRNRLNRRPRAAIDDG